MKNDKIKRVEEMENIMDKLADIFMELNMVLDKLEENLTDYKKLDEYYSSENWFLDVEDFNNGVLPQDLKCGVLSEDGAYNLFGENYELAIRMVELAAKMLRRQSKIQELSQRVKNKSKRMLKCLERKNVNGENCI